MEHYFELPVNYEGNEQSFKGRLVTFGYDYKFYIVVNGHEVVFESDEDGSYRAVTKPSEHIKPIDTKLLEAIIFALHQISLS
ncbi:hypothetical protein [Pinibacter soli]|uniref:Uncharacterized protein n=1 Tax=Pinibacter soli TaxID=3044211 RepID=A0ABT6RDF6_9BACT|nr:hypothetical protein [Pinibacter soli]MDI3320613.1 hypothetical protein [Pinibacter soli]